MNPQNYETEVAENVERYQIFSSTFDYLKDFLIDGKMKFNNFEEIIEFEKRFALFFHIHQFMKEYAEDYAIFMAQKIGTLFPEYTTDKKTQTIANILKELGDSKYFIPKVVKVLSKYFLDILDGANAQNYLEVIQRVEEEMLRYYELNWTNTQKRVSEEDTEKLSKFKLPMQKDRLGIIVFGKIDILKKRYAPNNNTEG